MLGQPSFASCADGPDSSSSHVTINAIPVSLQRQCNEGIPWWHLPVYIRHGVQSNNLVRTAWRFLETRNTPECVCVFLLAGSELFCLAHPVFSLVALIFPGRLAGGFCDFWGFLDLLEREPGIGRGKDVSQICLLKSCVAERFKVSITIVSQLSNTLTAALRQCL